MRSTTPCVFLSLKAACSAVVTLSALASVPGAMMPFSSTIAVCFLPRTTSAHPFLPVEFQRDVRAAVEIGLYSAAVAYRERGRVLPEVLDLEAHAASRIGERARGADQALRSSHSPSAVTLDTQPRGPQARSAGSGCAP